MNPTKIKRFCELKLKILFFLGRVIEKTGKTLPYNSYASKLQLSIKRFFSVDGDTSVNKLLFIQKRNLARDAASLVCSGPRGHVHFWSIYRGGRLYGRFNAVSQRGANVTCMHMTSDDTLLFTADSFG